MGNTNDHLHEAKKLKSDEFYTTLEDVQDELQHYAEHFADKVVYCNCDRYDKSNFCKYFRQNFDKLGLKALIATHLEENGCKTVLYKRGETEYVSEVTALQGNGDFRSEECIEILKEADIVVTNPPFSLFREYIGQLMKHGKKFLVLGNQNAITYKEIFPLIKSNQIWLGNKYGDMAFRVPEYFEPRATRYWVDESGQKWRSMGNICWFTNLDHAKRHKRIELTKEYSPELHKRYINYDGINVDKLEDIPKDYNGAMGVPITFLHKYCPEQFEIIKFRKGDDGKDLELEDKTPYFRILVKARS